MIDRHGIRLFYEEVLGQSLPWFDVAKAPKTQRLPNILTQNEIARIIHITRRFDLRCFWFVTYNLGLRLGETLRWNAPTSAICAVPHNPLAPTHLPSPCATVIPGGDVQRRSRKARLRRSVERDDLFNGLALAKVNRAGICADSEA
ncbi:MAG: hypothetical protein GKR94_04565 [Gammaproteobacteria bacterium]|nr:hypothetical protein [Gammaproteobacteria bacterium]